MVKQIIASGTITLTDLSDAIIGGVKPTNPKPNQLWIDDSKTPNQLWKWNGTSWIEQTLDLGKLDPDADGKIENHETTIGNMVDDAKIDITERQEVKNKLTPIIGQSVADNLSSLPTAAQLWTNGVGEVFTIRKAAQNVGIKTNEAVYVAVETAYNSLQTYLNGMTPKPWDASAANKDKPITVVPTDWRTKWLDYFKAVQTLTVAVQTKLQGNIDGINFIGRNLVLDSDFYLTSVGNKAVSFVNDLKDLRGKTISVSVDIEVVKAVAPPSGAFRIGFEPSVKYVDGTTQYFGAWKQLTAGESFKGRITNSMTLKDVEIESVVQNSVYVQTGGDVVKAGRPKLELGSKATEWTPAIEDIDKAIKDADKKAQDVTNSVNDMSLDSKLTPVEKIQLKTDYDSITAEFSTTLASADAFNLTSSSERAAYNTAYNALKTFVDPLLVKMNETSGVDRAVFRQRFKDYYDTKAKLLKKVSDTSKGLIDDVASQGANILVNSSFLRDETNLISKSWGLAANVTIENSNDFGGLKVIKSAQSGLSANAWRGANSKLFPVTTNKDMTVSIYAYSPDIAALDYGMSVEVRGYDISKNRIMAQTFAVETKPTKSLEWQRFNFTFKFTDPKVIYFEYVFYVRRNGIGIFAKPMIQYGGTLSEWSPNPNDLIIEELDKKAEESKNAIADMSSDNKLTPLEKVQLKKEWGTIAAEKPQFEALGKSYYGASGELNAYINAYNVLNNTLNGTTGYLKNMASTDTINGATFRAQFDTYYAKQAELIKKVNNIIQGNIDGIQSTRNILLNSKRAISVNDYLLNDYTLTEDFIAGQNYTFVVKGSVPSGQRFGIWQNGGSTNVGYAEVEFIEGSGIYYVTFKAVATTTNNQRSLRLYNVPQNTTSATVEWVALYKGTKPFDWSAAPEDADTGKTNLIVDSEFKYLANWIFNKDRTTIKTGIMPNGIRNIETIVTSSYTDFAQYIEVEPNTEYTFSCNSGGSFQIYLWEKKADKTATNVYKDNVKTFSNPWDMSSPRSTTTYTIKTQPDAKYIHFIFRVNYTGATQTGGRIALPQLEKGTTASEWKPNPFDTTNGEIFLQGSATDITDRNRKLTVNGNVIYDSIDGRGLRLVTLKKDTLAVVDDITYDVYGSDVPRNDLATKINSLGNDVFITLSSCDAINFNTNLLTALVSIGASGTILQGRLPYAFIGMKGLGRYNGLEQWTGLGNVFPPATISCKVVNGMIQGVNNNNGQSDANVRKDLRLNAPLPTSILMDANGITASGTDASKYARLDYRGLYIAGGAIQIDGGLSEAQLASGVTRKMSYLDSNGLYTGQVNIGGSGQNGILSIKNASNSEVVRGDTNGLTVNNGAITIYRPDGVPFIQNGMQKWNFGVMSHEPYFRGGNIGMNQWWWETKAGTNRTDQSCQFYSFQKSGRYLNLELGFYVENAGAECAVVIYDRGGSRILIQRPFTHNNASFAETMRLDLGTPNYEVDAIYLCLYSWSASLARLRCIRIWVDG